MNCDQCEMVSIQGIACHETGCPNAGRRWDKEIGEWCRVYECRECGCETTDHDAFLVCCAPEEDAPTTRDAEQLLYLDDHRGIYIPQHFAQQTYRDCVTGVSQEDWDILLDGPDNELYWDAWEIFLNDARITDKKNRKKYSLYQDGALWLIEAGAELDEDTDTWTITE